MTRPRSALLMFGPGLLVAATGVGAGDLAIGTITGSKLGVAILWAVVLGAALKFAMSEGLARWQIATGETLLDRGLIYGTTEFGEGWKHGVKDLPVVLAGSACGALARGVHSRQADGNLARAQLTALRAVGLDVPEFGWHGAQTSEPMPGLLL